jgi:hypothetical protein
MDRLAQQKQANEIATRLDAGESVTQLATEYGLERTTIWRRGNQGIAARMPHMDDDTESREELTGILWKRIAACSEKGDDKALVMLVDRLNKMNGFDHTHRIDLARLRLDAARIELMSQAMTRALEQADVPIPQRRRVLELIANAND